MYSFLFFSVTAVFAPPDFNSLSVTYRTKMNSGVTMYGSHCVLNLRCTLKTWVKNVTAIFLVLSPGLLSFCNRKKSNNDGHSPPLPNHSCSTCREWFKTFGLSHIYLAKWETFRSYIQLSDLCSSLSPALALFPDEAGLMYRWLWTVQAKTDSEGTIY